MWLVILRHSIELNIQIDQHAEVPTIHENDDWCPLSLLVICDVEQNVVKLEMMSAANRLPKKKQRARPWKLAVGRYGVFFWDGPFKCVWWCLVGCALLKFNMNTQIGQIWNEKGGMMSYNFIWTMVNLQVFSGCSKVVSLCKFIHSNAFGWVSKCFVGKMVVFKGVCCVCVCVDIWSSLMSIFVQISGEKPIAYRTVIPILHQRPRPVNQGHFLRQRVWL